LAEHRLGWQKLFVESKPFWTVELEQLGSNRESLGLFLFKRVFEMRRMIE